jgi:branched-chain amino acid transport system permease protein
MSIGPHLFLALLEGTVTAFVLALVALGLSLVFGVMRIVNIAHGEFFMLGAVLAWSSSMLVGGGALMGFVVALVMGPVLVVFGPDARPVNPPIYFRVAFPWFGYSGYKLVVAGVSGLLLVGTWLAMAKTKLGLYMRATQQDQEMAQAFGVPVRRVYATVFAVGAMLAAVAGVLVVPIQQAHYLMGLDPLLLSFIVVIIGGLGSLKGTMVAAFVVGISDGVVSVFFSPTLAKIVATLLVAAVLVIRPGGLFGKEGS